MNCDMISNPLMDISQLIASVNNPPGQPFQDIAIETTQKNDGGQVGGPGNANPNGGEIGNGQGDAQGALGSASVMRVELSHWSMMAVAGIVVLSTSLGW